MGLLLLLSSCSPPATAAVNEAVRDELGSRFAEEIRDFILPNRDAKSILREGGVYISDEGYVIEFESLHGLALNADANVDCVLTVAYYNSSFVVSRVQFYQGSGYYYRYEYNRFHQELIEVDFKPVLWMELEESEDYQSCKLTLHHSDKNHSVLNFRLEDRVNLPGNQVG